MRKGSDSFCAILLKVFVILDSRSGIVRIGLEHTGQVSHLVKHNEDLSCWRPTLNIPVVCRER